MSVRYCIQCCAVECIHTDEAGEWHLDVDVSKEDYRVCEGPFASCPPPDVSADYLENAVCSLSDEEQRQADESADSLMADIWGERWGGYDND